MSDEKNKVTDKAGEIAKNIWLAGVGAYGKAVEDAQGRLEKAMEPPKLFRDLVKAGAALEEDARDALESTAAARQSVEDRINRVRENFHMQRPAKLEELAQLHDKIDALTAKVEALSNALKREGISVSTARKTPVKKKVSAKAASVRKKAASKKKAPANKKQPARAKTRQAPGKSKATKKATNGRTSTRRKQPARKTTR
ncbi:MAG: phasin family protein [Pseudomonadota bacterium]